uniref:NADH dehydrogenase subunit 6 n=1 Tax=Pseudochauhanea macrorchis TaxID=1086615 RepID=H6U4R2_PSEMH|nr:NADH dehydrogenase subunit 6 [Pseudochauhanea macrorchis]AEO93248.1 NADH dehydrogenase subunit 6 [Pseudochauhanea macrorchis]
MITLLLFAIFVNLLIFCLINNPIFCSLLLMLNSIFAASITYGWFGVPWSSLLMCMVYLGGVYIIILFVSAHVQNDQVIFINGVAVVSMFLLSFFVGNLFFSDSFDADHFSHSGLFVSNDGICLFIFGCLILLISFYSLSIILCDNIFHLR